MFFYSAKFKVEKRLELEAFLVRSSFLKVGPSFWPMLSGTDPYSLIALLVAVGSRNENDWIRNCSVICQNGAAE